MKKYDLVLVGSSWNKNKLEQAGIKNVEVLIQGIDPEIFYPSESETDKKFFKIFSGGKFELRKGQDLVLKAVRILQQKYSDIVYAPYSTLVHQPEIVIAGKQFLDEHVAKAFARLAELKIKSHAFPDQLVVQTITPQFIKNIFLTEQTDPKLIMLAGDGGQKLAERVMVRLATNGETAFRYTYSKTGALGLGQIMPGTYDSVAKRYPNAKLIKDSGMGRVDIDNAIIASILVFDDHLQSVKDRVANAKSTQGDKYWQAIEDNSSKLEEVRAAIYNGGPGKYKVLTGTISIAINETVDFVRKFKLIRGLGLFQS